MDIIKLIKVRTLTVEFCSYFYRVGVGPTHILTSTRTGAKERQQTSETKDYSTLIGVREQCISLEAQEGKSRMWERIMDRTELYQHYGFQAVS